MGTVEQDINGGLMKKSKKKNKESIFSTEDVDNVLVRIGDSKTSEKEMIVQNVSKIDATHQENDNKRKRKKEKSKVRDEGRTSSVLESPKEAMNDLERDTVSESDGEVAFNFEKGDKKASEEGRVKEKKKIRRKNDDIQSVDANCNGVDDKKKKKKKEKRKNDDSGCSSEIYGVDSLEIQSNSDVIDKAESVEGKKKKKKRNECDDSDTSVISERNESAGVNVNGEDRKGKKKKKKKEGKEIVNCETNITYEAVEPCDQSVSHKKMKKVRFCDQDEVFPVPESSSKRKWEKKLDDDDNESGNGLIRGKRFSKEEDEIIERAVLDYIEEHKLSENGVEMVMKCKNYPELKYCWNEIGAALPHRPIRSVYRRAHILFERSGDGKKYSKWTQEELDYIRKFFEKHGAKWKKLAEDMGKHNDHVKDAWRRIKLPKMKTGDWSQDEYQQLFDLVNHDLSMKVFQEKKTKYGMLRDNIGWETISQKLSTRIFSMCCYKWYHQLSSPLVARGEWVDSDDYRLLIALTKLDAACEEDVDWENLLEHRSGDVCRERYNQMVRHIGYHGSKPFMDQVEVLTQRYCPDILEAREEYESRPYVD